jgi:hypothetical protein
MNVISRRDFHQQISGSLLTWSLLDTLFSRDAFADDVRLLASKWLANVNTISLDLKGGKLDQATWQKQVDQLLGKVDLPDLLKFLDFDKLTRMIGKVDDAKGERKMQSFSQDQNGNQNGDVMSELRTRRIALMAAKPHLDIFSAEAAVLRQDPGLAAEFKRWVFENSSRTAILGEAR